MLRYSVDDNSLRVHNAEKLKQANIMSRPNARLVGVVLISCLEGLLFGYDIGVIAGVKLYPSFLREFEIDPNTDAGVQSLEIFVSIFLLGCMFGGLTGFFIADSFGRKWSLFAGALLFNVSTITVCLARVFWLVLLARFFVGASVGSLSFVQPIYVSELVQANWRGVLVSLQCLLIVLGILLSTMANVFLLHSTIENSWAWAIGLAMVLSIPLNFMTPFLPETPRWLLRHRGYDEACKSLQSVRNEDAKEELDEIQQALKVEIEVGELSWGALLKSWCTCKDSIGRRIWIGCGLQLFQQLTGLNILLYYSPEVFKSVGVDEPLIATSVLASVNLLGTIAALLLISRLDRRTLLIGGAMGMGACMTITACLVGAFSKDSQSMPVAAAYTVIVFLMMFVFFFAASWGPLAWLIPTEIFPLHVRAKGVSLSTATNWFGNFVIGQLALSAIRSMSYGIYILLVCFHIIMALFTYFFVLETRNKTLEEIDMEYMTLETRSVMNDTEPLVKEHYRRRRIQEEVDEVSM